MKKPRPDSSLLAGAASAAWGRGAFDQRILVGDQRLRFQGLGQRARWNNRRPGGAVRARFPTFLAFFGAVVDVVDVVDVDGNAVEQLRRRCRWKPVRARLQSARRSRPGARAGPSANEEKYGESEPRAISSRTAPGSYPLPWQWRARSGGLIPNTRGGCDGRGRARLRPPGW